MPILGGLPPRNRSFVGREDLLARLRTQLANGPVVLLPDAEHPLGGTGRTQLAVEYVYRYAETYELVWWIPAEQTAETRRALIGLAQRLGLPEAGDINRTLGAVRDALSRGTPYRNWLVVFESANRPEDINAYLPSGAGHVLVTSRNPRWTADVAQTVPIGVFDRADSVDLLRRRSPELTVTDADRVADRLGDVPMALDLAAAVRAATGWPVAEYLERHQRCAGELAFPTPVRVAWGLAADGLREAAPAAYELLQLCAFLGGAPVAWHLLWGARSQQLPAELARTVRIERRLLGAMRLIGRYGLADLDPSGAALLVHPLIRGMLAQELSSQRHAALLAVVRGMLAAADPGNPDDPAGWPRYAELTPHLIHSDVLGAGAEEIRQLVINCVRYHFARGDYDSSRVLAAAATDRWRDTLGETDEQTLLACFHLANALRAVGRTGPARTLNQQTLRIQREVLGGDDETTLATANSVGADLRIRGHFGQARQLDADNLVRYRRLFGESFPTALRCANNLAADLRLLGDFRGARTLDEQTLRHRLATLTEDHPETLSSRAGLAFDLFGLGDYVGAAEVLAVGRPDTVAEDHPFALWASRIAAMAARRRGQPAALELADENLALSRRRFGDLHSETLAALVSLATCTRAQGAFDQAHELLERAVLRYHSVLGDDHPFTLAASAGLAAVVRATGRYAEARRIDQEALGGLRRSVGPDHPFTLSCANGYAADLFGLGERQEAQQLVADSWQRFRLIRGAEHPDTLACAWNAVLGGGDEARHQTTMALAKAYGEGHPVLARVAAGERLEIDVDLPPL